MRVGIVKEDIYLHHIMSDFHPESPERLKSIYSMLEEIDQTGLVYVPARMVGEDVLSLVHDRSYIEVVRATQGKNYARLDPDTETSPRSYEAACMAVGGVLSLADALMAGEIDNGFALVRPPGHHAERHKAMGFCIFNNIAIGAKYVQKKYGIKRILIVDFDVHHGNGTQHSFCNDPTVLYVSTHQHPFYPGTGSYEEIGGGNGTGYTVNVPLSGGAQNDDYLYIFREIIAPVSRLFKPEMVLVSAGFDIHVDDPLGGMSVTEEGFGTMAGVLIDIAQSECDGKILFVLEGGYDLKGLADGVKAVIGVMKGTSFCLKGGKGYDPSRNVIRVVSRVKEVIRPYWQGF